ncbi:MFS transporter [Kribbella speibonae]|uniref:MFS transporter n=1 Tax=Kribbella speibonae TaxID=1572660 RepID=A0A4R0J6M6_9ACTN|nr:MFS transporter [Kribbella speibonae]TCC42243.1 MFS transporter [Kribbella speibonae]
MTGTAICPDPPTPDCDDGPARAGRREWLGLAVLALPTILIGLDGTALHLAAPALSKDLAPSSSQLLWIIDVYGFVVAGLLVTMGTVGDRIGRRRLLLIGAAGFLVASLLAAFATSSGQLIAARALLGVAGATLMPSTLSLLSNMFRDPGQRRMAIAIWMTNFMIGGMAGPLVGGVLLDHFWWGSVFLIGVPPLLLLLVVARPLLPEFRNEQAGRIDPLSVVLSIGAIISLVYAVKETAKSGPHLSALAVAVVGVGLGWVFVRRQLRLPEPLLDLRLFSRPAFGASLGAQMFGLYVLAAVQFLAVQYFQLVLGMTPLEAGLWMLPTMVAGIVGTLGAPYVVRVLRPGTAMTAGFLAAAPGLALMTASERWTVVVGLSLAGLGIQLVLALTYDVIVSSAPPERAGVASGMGETGTELGIALGIAIAGSIVTAVYRAGVSVPVGAPDSVRDTLGNAVAEAQHLPAPVAQQLLTAARDAYTDGVQVAAWVSVAMVLVLAATTAKLVRTR